MLGVKSYSYSILMSHFLHRCSRILVSIVSEMFIIYAPCYAALVWLLHL